MGLNVSVTVMVHTVQGCFVHVVLLVMVYLSVSLVVLPLRSGVVFRFVVMALFVMDNNLGLEVVLLGG